MGSSAGILQAGMMIEFIVAEPFGDEIKGKSQTLKGSDTIAGEDCYVIVVVYQQEQAPQATWYISKKDFLPRARLDEIKLPDGREWGIAQTHSPRSSPIPSWTPTPSNSNCPKATPRPTISPHSPPNQRP